MAFRPISRTDDPIWREEPNVGWLNPALGQMVDASAGHVIATNDFPIAAGASYDIGDLVRTDGAGNLVELTAITQTIRGAALESVSNGLALGPVTNRALVALSNYTNPDTSRVIKNRFGTTDVNNVTPAASHIGSIVGLSFVGGNWRIDVADAVNQHVTIIGIDTVRQEFWVEIRDSQIQS